MARQDRFWSMLAAGFAAWMLVLQSVAGALAIGAGPAAGLDAFGNALCMGDPSADGAGPGDDGDHRPCCALGCMPGGLASVAPASGAALDAPLPASTVVFADARDHRPTGSAQPGLERSHAPPPAA